ncbi:MAG: RHS repeat-associated core domain-containing protein [Actinomycetota bacterium]
MRLYAPALGRFLQPDPQPGGSANDYDYATADPVNQVDLDGQAAYPGGGTGEATPTSPPKASRGAGRMIRHTLSVKRWIGDRNWGDLVSAPINAVLAYRLAQVSVGAFFLAGMGCGSLCVAAGVAYGTASVGRGVRVATNLNNGFRRCTAFCSTRNQVQHAGLNVAPTPLGPMLRCRMGGCHRRWDWWTN